MEKENVIKEVWPYNLMQRLLGEEDYQKWKTQVPTDFEASLDYFLYATFSERDEGILRKFYQECWQVRDIAKHYSLTAQSIRNIVKHNVRCMASQDNRTYLMMGMTDFLNAQNESLTPKATGVALSMAVRSGVWIWYISRRKAQIICWTFQGMISLSRRSVSKAEGCMICFERLESIRLIS